MSVFQALCMMIEGHEKEHFGEMLKTTLLRTSHEKDVCKKTLKKGMHTVNLSQTNQNK